MRTTVFDLPGLLAAWYDSAPDYLNMITMPFTPPLFDRFSPDGHGGIDALARDIADLLGARRAFRGRAVGILNWGLPGTIGMTPHNANDRRHVAARIAEALRQFQPAIENVRVTPVPDTPEFTFEIDATFTDSKDESLTLRIMSPRLGGTLGAGIALQKNTATISEFATLPGAADDAGRST